MLIEVVPASVVVVAAVNDLEITLVAMLRGELMVMSPTGVVCPILLESVTVSVPAFSVRFCPYEVEPSIVLEKVMGALFVAIMIELPWRMTGPTNAIVPGAPVPLDVMLLLILIVAAVTLSDSIATVPPKFADPVPAVSVSE